MNINKFTTLNMMQYSTKKCPDMGDCWELKVTCKMKSVIRSRVVAFIRKIEGDYVVTLTSKRFKSFMAALASLFSEYVEALRKLIMAMACPVGAKTSDYEMIVDKAMVEFLKPRQPVPVPHLPTYDRGAKKEVLHPLRRKVTEAMGGKYSR